MFDNLRKFFGGKSKSMEVGRGSASTRGWQSVYGFSKGLSFDNAYPSITRIANEFMTIRPYGIDNNGKTIQDSAVINKLYHPNQQMSGAAFREAIAVLSLVFPKVYILVWSYDEKGHPATGAEITPDNLAGFTILEGVSEYYNGEEKIYRVGTNEYREFEVVELKSGINPYDLSKGYSPSTAGQKWASIDDYIASYQAGFFENGAVPAGQFVITAGTPQEFNEIVDSLQARHRGSGRNNNVMYVHRPVEQTTGKPVASQIEWVPFAEANKNLDLATLFEQANKKIDSVYGVPASVRGVNENNTYASVRIDEQIFIKYTIKPFATRIWGEFTHQLNRITGGLGFAITFDLEIPGVAEEEKLDAERKTAELGLIKAGLELGYSLDSLVDAFELSNGYKTLKMSETPPKIENDKPEVDDGDEVEESPEDISSKSEHKCGGHCKHCLKAEIKTKNAETKTFEEDELEENYRNLIKSQVESAISSDFENTTLDKNALKKFENVALALIFSMILKKGEKSWSDLSAILEKNGVSTQDLTHFEISNKLKKHYETSVANFTKSFSEDTAKSIASVVGRAEMEEWNKEQLARELRGIVKADEWRVQRIARTETHRAKGLAGVEAGVQIQNESGVRIWKEWVVVSGNPCGYCAGMNGKRVNVSESYVRKGGVMVSKAKIRINDYENIDTAGAHPNCSCVERFGVEEDEVSKEPEVYSDIRKLIKNSTPEAGDITEQDGAKPKPHERSVANIIHTKIGGNIEFLREYRNKKNADIFWRDGLWDIKKSNGSTSSIVGHIRKASKQTDNNGVIIDVDLSRSKSEILADVVYGMKRYNIKQAMIIVENEIIEFFIKK